jgi:uncharacterized protein
MIHQFIQGEGFNVTIHTNTNCTLKCSYCYEYRKAASINRDQEFWSKTSHADEIRNYDFANDRPHNDDCVIDIEIVKKFIDQILDISKTSFFKDYVIGAKGFRHNSIILDFIGGDALQYPELLDQILTYFCEQLALRNHEWMYAWQVSISSNGVTLQNPKAREFCEKWRYNLSMGLSIDGCPELHDLNRWCFADNPDGTHRGSWKYIQEIWPWYTNTFQDDSQRTKWTLAPNSYKYLMKSVKFLHEELKMRYVFFNRVMEDDVFDSADELWELIQQFQQVVDYQIEHHADLYCYELSHTFTQNKSKDEQLNGKVIEEKFIKIDETLPDGWHETDETVLRIGHDEQPEGTRRIVKRDESTADPTWSRCGFGRMPALSLDGNVYPCFRMLPGSNHISDSAKYKQGTFDDVLSNEATLRALNDNSRAVNMKIKPKCETCKIFTNCPHCAADCVNEEGATLTKTSTVCNYTRLQVYFARKYWERIKVLHPWLYRNQEINWTEEDNEELMLQVLNELIELKEKENEAS